MKNYKNIFVILVTSIMILVSSCSLLIDGYLRRFANNSICWEDNDHILVYTIIAAYDDYITIGGDARSYIWSGGEIWRIDVNTGEKELVLRKKGPEYTITYEYAVITLQDTFRFISDWDTTYQMDENYDNWEPFGPYTCPQVSEDGKKIVYLQESYEVEDVYVKELDLDTGIKTILWQGTGNIESMDYDFDRNLLLLNNIRLINLNTGMDTILLHHGEEIGSYTIYSPDDSRYGIFLEDKIIIDVESNNALYNKVYIEIDSLDNKSVIYGLKGIESPDGSKYASGEDNGVEIRNSYGALITKIIFDNSGL